MKDLARYRAAWHSSAANYDETAHLTTMPVPMGWRSAGADTEWIYIDLGTVSQIDDVEVVWGETFARCYEIQLSDDAVQWCTVAAAEGARDEAIRTPVSGQARFVRVLCTETEGDHYEIRAIHVFGQNDLEYGLAPMPEPEADGTQKLTGGRWTLGRAEQIASDGAALSQPGFDDAGLLPATVPGTALVSYLNAGAIPDPDFDDDQFQISEAFFTADFWYRNTFPVPADREGQRVYLDFDAINWKADVFFNGVFLENELKNRKHSIEGAFIRSRFDVTDLVRFGADNGLAVKIYKNETPGPVTTQGLAEGPGPNGGPLGADNPTIHAAVGWDWLPTIRGRDIGIYGDVYLRYSGPLELVDPWMQTDLELLSETSSNPAKDLMDDALVIEPGKDPKAFDGWQGLKGDSFILDLGASHTLGCVTLIWGTEAVGGAADLESRYPAEFRLERSADGQTWENFDAYPGGQVELRFLGMRDAAPHKGSDVLEGHSISDSVQGADAKVEIDLSFIGRGIIEQSIFQPQTGRYIRFTVLKQRTLGDKEVDTRVREIRIYEQSPEEIEQGMKHDFVLDTSKAQLTMCTEVRNRGSEVQEAELTITVGPDDLSETIRIQVGPGQVLPVQIPMLLKDPILWWPNTYGAQFLYTCTAQLKIDGAISDTKSWKFGVRRFDYPIDGGLLTLYCNGVRVVCKGGNWGLDDGLKRDTRRVYFDKVRLHAEENMNMIRNWVGMTGHPAFYEACDQYGILIWDDFWLANPFDGPEPNDNDLFLENAADKIRAVRGHAALALYCGRNEGNPNDVLNSGLKQLTDALDGTHLYVPHSADAPVGSGGGYALAAPGGDKGIKQYFADVSSTVIRSERGVPNVPELSSLKRFLKPENLWPISESWALHDWTYHSNGPANTYMQAVETYLGGGLAVPVDHINPFDQNAEDMILAYKKELYEMIRESAELWTVEDFSRAAQMINYDNHRGMFEALASRRAGGLLMWMSQSSWPSFMWQTYDFYLDVNGGYFGCKAGNQEVKPVFDPRDGGILLTNQTPSDYENVTCVTELFDLNGALVDEQKYNVEHLASDAYAVPVPGPRFELAPTDIVFFRLALLDEAGQLLGQNLYWHNWKQYQDYRAMNRMPKAEVKIRASEVDAVESMRRWNVTLTNGPVPAVGVRLSLLDGNGRKVLPTFYSDNYVTMMPGETKTLAVECHADTLTGAASWSLGGWNL